MKYKHLKPIATSAPLWLKMSHLCVLCECSVHSVVKGPDSHK